MVCGAVFEVALWGILAACLYTLPRLLFEAVPWSWISEEAALQTGLPEGPLYVPYALIVQHTLIGGQGMNQG